jgi:hypothetical protein
MDDDRFQLMLLRSNQTERDKSNDLYSRKIVERIFIAFLGTVATAVIGLIVAAFWQTVIIFLSHI